MRLKNDASTETRLTRRWTLRGLSSTSMPNTWALPPSLISSVDSSRTSVDLPEPFWPRMARHSPRCIVKLSPCSAATRRRRPRTRAPPSRRMNSLRRLWTWTAGTADTVDTSSDGRGWARCDAPQGADEQDALVIGRRARARRVFSARPPIVAAAREESRLLVAIMRTNGDIDMLVARAGRCAVIFHTALSVERSCAWLRSSARMPSSSRNSATSRSSTERSGASRRSPRVSATSRS